MTKFKLDGLDRELIALLSEDARVSNREIADRLGVTESTIRSRLKRMQSDGVIKITAITNTDMTGTARLFMIGIDAGYQAIPAISKALSQLSCISSVVVMMGRYSVFATGFFSSIEEADSMMRNSIRCIHGVNNVDISACLKTYKYDSRLARILPSKFMTSAA